MYTGPHIKTTNLIFHYDTANTKCYIGSGTSITDQSTSNVSGTLVNGVSYSSLNKGYLIFDGINDYINLNNPSTLQNISEGTIEIWYNRYTTNSTYQMIFTDGNSLLEVCYYQNILRFYIGNSSVDFTYTNLNEWIYFVGTWSVLGNSKKMYLNSVLKNSNGNTLTSGSISRYIGSRGGGLPFNGAVANVKIYNSVLTQTEITNNFNSQKSKYGL